MHAEGALSNYFAKRLGVTAGYFSGAWVSESDADGESDLVLSFDGAQGQVVALIENKIAAPFQPDQAFRYSRRRDRWSEDERISRVVTVLVAPESYMTRAEAAEFDVRITYEELADILRREHDRRSLFLSNSLLAGIERSRRGYSLIPDDAVSSAWQEIWQIAARVAPRLNLAKPMEKPKESTWIYFYDADGFEQVSWRTAVVVYKAERGQVDLQFGGTIPSELERRTAHIRTAPMNVFKAGKSSSLRMLVPVVDFVKPALEQEAAIIEGLATCEELRTFFVEHRVSLLS
ncbi:hypothetical protein CWR43_14320 [Rhizobium sullae]|uniref:PD-(D/E)XK nuclease superfamily protein n=2 Tax=Rhizobium sullae TaxID=50338 RepID=A0A2N0DAV4_RHISU|nr:hypothetical protein CWR43_14320 [Rhizobium sullae]